MEKINLQDIQKYYDENLCNRTFHYELTNGVCIDVKFYIENLCHLLGLQHIYEHDKRYLGLAGYNKIKQQAITTSRIEAHNQKGFNFVKLKLSHFKEIHKLMLQGEFIKFYPDRALPKTKIRADFVLYEKGKEYIIHLFLVKENPKTNEYAPTSFVVKSKNDKFYNQYTQNQEHKIIKTFTIIDD